MGEAVDTLGIGSFSEVDARLFVSRDFLGNLRAGPTEMGRQEIVGLAKLFAHFVDVFGLFVRAPFNFPRDMKFTEQRYELFLRKTGWQHLDVQVRESVVFWKLLV